MLSAAFLVTAVLMRSYAVRVQDRVIRLEERLRLHTLLPPAENTVLHGLSTPQLAALRFAPDEEVGSLALRAVAESLTPKQIKEGIGVWKADHHRV